MSSDAVATLSGLVRGMRSVDLAPKLERGMLKFPTHPHMVIDPTVVHARDDRRFPCGLPHFVRPRLRLLKPRLAAGRGSDPRGHNRL